MSHTYFFIGSVSIDFSVLIVVLFFMQCDVFVFILCYEWFVAIKDWIKMSVGAVRMMDLNLRVGD